MWFFVGLPKLCGREFGRSGDGWLPKGGDRDWLGIVGLCGVVMRGARRVS